jgi:hypothetical protein
MGLFGGCGPSGEEKDLAASQASFSKMLQSNYATQFGKQADILDSLNHTLNPIVAAGPSQTGFSAPELSALNTRALESTGANYASAARAVNGQLAGRGGAAGQSGVDTQIKAALASEAAKTLSNQQLGITSANYAQGRENFNNAAGGMRVLAGLYDPTGYAGQGTQANSTAFGQAKTIQEQQAAKMKAITGAITGLGMTALTGGLGALSGGVAPSMPSLGSMGTGISSNGIDGSLGF